MDGHKLTAMHAAIYPTHYVLAYKTLAVSWLHTAAWTCLDPGNHVNAFVFTPQGHAKYLPTFLSRSMIVPRSQALGRKMAKLCWGNSNSLIGAKCDKRGPWVLLTMLGKCGVKMDLESLSYDDWSFFTWVCVIWIWELAHCVGCVYNFCVIVSLGSGSIANTT
jgi:hypothetical protein